MLPRLAEQIELSENSPEGDRGNAEMRIEGQPNAWALGDCALIINAFDNKPSPPTGQFAERQGRQAVPNLVRILKGEAPQPFRFKALGQLCSIGGYEAVAENFFRSTSGEGTEFLPLWHFSGSSMSHPEPNRLLCHQDMTTFQLNLDKLWDIVQTLP